MDFKALPLSVINLNSCSDIGSQLLRPHPHTGFLHSVMLLHTKGHSWATSLNGLNKSINWDQLANQVAENCTHELLTSVVNTHRGDESIFCFLFNISAESYCYYTRWPCGTYFGEEEGMRKRRRGGKLAWIERFITDRNARSAVTPPVWRGN